MPTYQHRRGRVYAVTGGAPSGALVVTANDCLWTLPTDRHAWTLAPTAVLPIWTMAQIGAPTTAAVSAIRDDLKKVRLQLPPAFRTVTAPNDCSST